jgi:hypothetical protein
VSRQDFEKLFGITEILGVAYGGEKVYPWAMAVLGLMIFDQVIFWFTHCLHIVTIIVRMRSKNYDGKIVLKIPML